MFDVSQTRLDGIFFGFGLISGEDLLICFGKNFRLAGAWGAYAVKEGCCIPMAAAFEIERFTLVDLSIGLLRRDGKLRWSVILLETGGNWFSEHSGV